MQAMRESGNNNAKSLQLATHKVNYIRLVT